MSELRPPVSATQESEIFEILCDLAVVNPTPQQVQRIAQLDSSSIDWARFQRSAEFHGLLPWVARNLLEHGPTLPPDVAHSLRSAYETNLRKNLRFSAELARIVRQFADRRVRVIPFKGPHLAETAYADLGLRSFSDLDLLIFPRDFARAKAALAEIGYQPSEEFSSAVERLALATGYERSFDGSIGRNAVELQWAAMPYFYAVDLDIDLLLSRARCSTMGGCEVLSLSPEDLLLMLCVHAAKHLWGRLIWIADIAQTIRTQNINYAQVVDHGRMLGITRILATSFWLAQNLLHAELPAAAQLLMAADSDVPPLGSQFADSVARGATYDLDSTKYFRQILRLRERRHDRWRYGWRLVWTPSSADIATLRLPLVLFPFYRIIRVARLTRKLVLRSDT